MALETETPKPDAAEPKARAEEQRAEPKASEDSGQDPMVARLVARERELETVRKEAATLKETVKKYERDARKGAVLSALYAEFPTLPAADVRGAALVAADDGAIDLYAEDMAPAVSKLKELLAARTKAAPARPSATPLGGTPGTPGTARPASANRLPI